MVQASIWAQAASSRSALRRPPASRYYVYLLARHSDYLRTGKVRSRSALLRPPASRYSVYLLARYSVYLLTGTEVQILTLEPPLLPDA